MSNNPVAKFKELLKEIFEFDSFDLDFGIYRILNLKRELFEQFIEHGIEEKLNEIFSEIAESVSADAKEKLQKAKENLTKTLGEEALEPDGSVKKEFEKFPVAKNYISARNEYIACQKIEAQKIEVFNDLYNFFSRFYEDGDFMPRYRYSSRKHRYSIPYNGEEVKLYWATADQYYVKTGTLFKDYTFKAGDYRIIFRTVAAREEIGSNKAKKERFFVLDSEKPVELDNTENELIVRFQYRELTDQEVKNYGVEGGSNRSKQEKINENLFSSILTAINDLKLKRELEKPRNEKAILLYHLNRFSAKNTRDYFIHKNIGDFLLNQLDYFLKSEVLNFETLTNTSLLNMHIARAKAVKQIAEYIIDFIAKIEDFQKTLWEKKKFVVQTHYVITLDRIAKWCGKEFTRKVCKEILNNEKQIREWEELGFGKFKSYDDLIFESKLDGEEFKKLPVDTRHFDDSFKERLIEKISEKVNLEDALDGFLIKSENWQAMNLLLEKYKEKVQTIYIDPPFNKEQDADYLYNVKYKDSTWITLLENRLRLARDLLSDRGSIFVRCDYNGNMYVRLLMNEIFGEENFRNEIVVRRVSKQDPKALKFNTATDSLYFYSKSDFKFKPLFKNLKKVKGERWHAMDSQGEGKALSIFGYLLEPPKGRHWTYGQEIIKKMEQEGRIRLKCKKCGYIHTSGTWNGCPSCGNLTKVKVEYLLPPTEKKQIDSNWTDISGYTSNWNFPTENSEILLKRVIESTSNEGDLVMDFFLGSGTTTAVAHKLKRKWIGIEMGEHFWTVVLPRMKKVLAYDKSGISKEKDVKEKYNEKTAGGFFKYQILEQYEDTLDNLEIKTKEPSIEFFTAGVSEIELIKYILEPDNIDSPAFAGLDALNRSFNYRMKINFSEVGEPQETTIDIIETFNYLIGLNVNRVWYRENNGRKYAFIAGEKDGKLTVVVWREWNEYANKNDYVEDRNFIMSQLEPLKPEVVYISANSALNPGDIGEVTEINYIEPEFKQLMFGA